MKQPEIPADSAIPDGNKSLPGSACDIPHQSSVINNQNLLNDQALSVCVLASGSKGNAIYVGDDEDAVLFDAGLSGIQIERRMAVRGLSPETLRAIVVSHEHSDHIRGVGVLSRRYRLPVYLSPKTASVSETKLGKLAGFCHFECGKMFSIGPFSIHPFSTSHDAVDPAGFTIRGHNIKLGIATDLGRPTSVVVEHLKGCHALVIEANHDPGMLINGSYPWELKQRIKGRTGHLSNPDTRQLLTSVLHGQLRHVILAHLSEENNSPDKAGGEIAALTASGGITLTICRQDTPTELFRLSS